MTSFFVANAIDAIITTHALRLGLAEEKGFIQPLMEGHLSDALIIKTAIPAFLVGIYALSQHHTSKWTLPVDRAIRMANVLTWSVVAWNTLQMNATVVEAEKHILQAVIR